MSRQIKFRTWDKNCQSFIGPVNILGDQKYVVLPENWPWENYCETVNLSTSAATLEEAAKQRNEYARKNWIVQQFTGLLDKNGVEIYEGDVVSFEAGEPNKNDQGFYKSKAEVEFKNGAFWPRPIKQECEDPWYDYELKNIEIIGNIFQNQELLVN